MNTAERLEKLRDSLCLTWGELADKLAIGRSMVHYLKTGERQASPKLLRRIIELEAEAGIATTALPSIGKVAGNKFQSLKERHAKSSNDCKLKERKAPHWSTMTRAELEKFLAELNGMRNRVKEMLKGGGT